MLTINGRNKVSLAFGAGALTALRKMGRLNEIRIIRGVGTGNILLGFFQVALTQQEFDWNTHFLYPLLRFCTEGVSGECMWQRLIHPTRWLQSWTTEILHYFRQRWPDMIHLSSPQFKFQYVCSWKMTEFDHPPLLSLDTDLHLTTVSYDPNQTAYKCIHETTPLYARVCASAVDTPVACIRQSNDTVLWTSSCVDTDPFGPLSTSSPRPHFIIDSLPFRYTMRQRTLVNLQPETRLIAAMNADWNGAFAEHELSVLDLMTLFDQDQSGWESVPYFFLVQAVNWGFAMAYYRLQPETELKQLYMHENVDDTYGILNLFKPQLP